MNSVHMFSAHPDQQVALIIDELKQDERRKQTTDEKYICYGWGNKRWIDTSVTYYQRTMSKLQILSVFLTERLTLAAQEIFKAVEDMFSEYNEEICRSRQEIELLKRRLQQAGVQMDSG